MVDLEKLGVDFRYEGKHSLRREDDVDGRAGIHGRCG